MTCKNCGNELRPYSDYCDRCGAKVIRNRITLKNLLDHFYETFINWDNKFLQTVFSLIKRPDEVIETFITGVRKRYVGPLSFVAISLTISGFYLLVIQKYFPEAMDMRDFYDSAVQQKVTEEITSYVMEYNSLLYFLLIPALALISWVVFLNKRYNLVEHMVIYFYTISLYSLVSSVTNIIVIMIFPKAYLPLSFVMMGVYFLYMCWVLKKLFGLTFGDLIIRILIFLPLFLILYIGGSFFIAMLYLLFTDASWRDFAPPPS